MTSEKTWPENSKPHRQRSISSSEVMSLEDGSIGNFFLIFFSSFSPRLIESYVSFRIKKLGTILTCSGGYYPITWPEWAWYWSNGLHCKLESRETGSFLDIWYNDNGVDIVRWIMEVRECTIIKELFKQL